MSDSLNLPAESLGQCLLQGLQKQVDHYLHYRRAVLSDRDPEDLHQLRVSLRRLRSLLENYDFALSLPKAVSLRSLSTLGRRCGRVRDLDVLLEALHALPKPERPQEAHQLLQLQRKLKKRCGQARRQLQRELKRSRYQHCILALRNWLAKPRFQAAAHLAIADLLPELVLPSYACLHLHPAWWIDRVAVERLRPIDNRQLHDLRKTVKRFRYGVEVLEFSPELDFEPLLQRLKPLQTALGNWQDRATWTALLAHQQANWQQRIPSLADRWQQDSQVAWRQWLEQQQTLREPSTGLQVTVYDCLGWRSPQSGRISATPS
ncbi:CHAD domain-containing protein [Synechococcus elongatus]|uniref:CHAD domain-containing protein n=2 Tax=Synechococcus elongatus TaxID=32046 RepID=Q31NL9_SYNE7|nr:CHAD domain-containing protein [Synechococcus elongatus]ABB57350.1 conserved hypothetical protein [Synechococcus elongatus PCC 7942 = FACHB-805]AJD58140.1 hypothetical protein M744_10020 [Synechococcus elongatus UTEX 2973]MBD2587757.1 CHAD domain-containing protein [Synechococcus elongatus FACHB-242]MBD2688464.1 CHAD domain-containing protein [Synechococcus elongatus FACHB-1061]MBD2707535.1 CHAD domain-containing protein [Synechococcus elongatus PCC 7942 = FACHB-805]